MLNRSPLFHAADKFYGGWKGALIASGIDYSKILKQKQWTKQEIIEEIRNLEKQSIDLSYKNIRKIRKELIWAAENNFGSLAKAINSAGIDYWTNVARTKNKYWTKDLVVKKIKEVYLSNEDLSYQGIIKGKRKGLLDAAVNLFGSWENAINESGLNYFSLTKLTAQTNSFKKMMREKLPPDKLDDLYNQDGLSMIEIGLMYETSPEVISTLLKEYKIEAKRPKFGYKELLLCKDGHKVKSNLERNTCNWLFENGINHEYEPRISCKREFKADFKL